MEQLAARNAGAGRANFGEDFGTMNG